MTRFPKIPTERTCRTEMMTRAEVRQSYKIRLTDERNAAQRLLAQDGTDAESGGA